VAEFPEHWNEWLTTGRATLVSVSVSRAFDSYLGTLPWLPTSLNWDVIPASELDYAAAAWDAGRALDWSSARGIGRHERLFLMTGADSPGMVTTFADGIGELDWLTKASTHYAYLSGADFTPDGIAFAFHDFVEWDGFARLRAPDPVLAAASATLLVPTPEFGP
jgi:hypothetical protein